MKTKADRDFLKYVKNHLKEHGFKLVVGKGRMVNGGGYRVHAFFSESTKEIRVGSKVPQFLQYLVHEYAHFLQFLDKEPLYTKVDPYLVIMENWFAGKEYSEKELQKAFFAVRAMERDCEMRTVELIEKWGLSIDKKEYTRKANTYIYAHFLMLEKRKWWPFKTVHAPYHSRTLQNAISDSFKVKSHSHCPPKVIQELRKLTK